MRIVYVLTSLGMGGAERQVLMLADRMAQRGHAVRLMVLRPPVSEQWTTNIEVHHLSMTKTPGAFFVGLGRGRRLLQQFQPDLVHSHSFHANVMARVLKVLVRRPTVLSTVHNVYEGGRVRMLAYRMSDGMSCATTAVSQAAADRFIRLRAVSAGKCMVVENGIDLGEFAPDPGRRAQTRRELGVDSEFVWLAAGRIVPAKDYANLLRAFERVRAARMDAQLWVAGAADAAYMAQLAASAEFRALGRVVRWLGLRRDVQALLDGADGFVLSSAWEGLPLALAEAMAMEKPVVGTAVGGVRELVGGAGSIVPAGDPDALAESMLSVMALPEERRQAQGSASRARICARFNIEAKVDEWEALYHSLLKRER